MDESAAEALCLDLISGSRSDAEIAEVLTGLRTRGESAAEVAGFAKAIRSQAPLIPFDGETFDVCGTGGSALDRFNVSTAVAFILACFELKVAKHGNKGSRRPNGSFDLLEVLGFPLDLSPDSLATCLKRTNLAFFFARKSHPAMKAVASARQRVGGRTIFNLAGPLSNPTAVSKQVIGTADSRLLPVLAEAAERLGRRDFAVVWGEPGIDELSTCGDSMLLRRGTPLPAPARLSPEDLGLLRTDYSELPTGLAEANATVLVRLLENEGPGGLRDMVCLNAGLALEVAGLATNLKEGLALAGRALATGDAKRKMAECRSLARSLSPGTNT